MLFRSANWMNSKDYSPEENLGVKALVTKLTAIAATGELTDSEQALIARGLKIKAIKEYRERHPGVSLSQAKEWIERHMNSMPHRPAIESNRLLLRKLLESRLLLDSQIELLTDIIQNQLKG